jgi:hypothetical protein
MPACGFFTKKGLRSSSCSRRLLQQAGAAGIAGRKGKKKEICCFMPPSNSR